MRGFQAVHTECATWLSGSKQEQEHVLMCHTMLRGCGFQPCKPPCEFSAPAVKLDVKRSFHRHGAEEARGAHNSEVTRSKRVAGIYHTSHWCIKALEHLITDMAQRQRAGLITLRSQDRNLLSVFITHRIGASRHWSNSFTGVAQRKRAGLITPRT